MSLGHPEFELLSKRATLQGTGNNVFGHEDSLTWMIQQDFRYLFELKLISQGGKPDDVKIPCNVSSQDTNGALPLPLANPH